MGCYDFVGKEYIQIKLLNCEFIHYNVGDKIDLEDGLYIAYEGYFVVNDGKILITDNKIYDKWGGELTTSELIDKYNPLGILAKQIEEVYETKNNIPDKES